MFRSFRILILLLVLFSVALGNWLARARSTSWEHSLRMVVFPIDADGSPATARYIGSLSRDTFAPIDAFMASEAQRYGLTLRDPLDIDVAPPVTALPPPVPHGGNAVQIVLWSLRLRYWAWANAQYAGPTPQVRMFVLYHDPERVSRLSHSLGLQKGLIGVVNAFATDAQAGPNNVIIAHEMLHTLGANDKYDPSTNYPLQPLGFAEPELAPLFPQRFAEIMGGRVPISPGDARIPDSLDEVLIGAATALEIRWLQ
ncbi:MAG TPA: hypothetical protein VIA64_17005 [Burkholderiales bacterium]|jgi:hypothetical protein